MSIQIHSQPQIFNNTVTVTSNLSAQSYYGDGSSITNITVPTLATIKSLREQITISNTVPSGTINFDAINQGILMHSVSASGNWKLNIRGNVSTSLNSLLSTGDSFTIEHMAPQGTIARYCSAVSIDSINTNQIFWQQSPPSFGNIDSSDVYLYQIIKTANNVFKIFASQTQFSSPNYNISF